MDYLACDRILQVYLKSADSVIVSGKQRIAVEFLHVLTGPLA